MVDQEILTISTDGRGFYDITPQVAQFVRQSAVEKGLCHVFIQHTSASLLICENADPTVRIDVENFFSRLVTDGDERYEHCYEGADDMAGHLRSILTESSVQLPISHHELNLGTWQGIYLYEHRYRPHQRKIVLTSYG